MTACKHLAACPFFHDRMANMPGCAELLKEIYCRRDAAICARYRVREALGADGVPADLFPNHGQRADTLLGMGVPPLPAGTGARPL